MEKEKKKINKIKILVLIIILLVIFFTIGVIGRYVTNNIRDMYATSKEFYFMSNKLDVNTPIYRITNWSGLGEYKVSFDLQSQMNDLQKLDYDLDYIIECECKSTKIDCRINSELPGVIYNGTIYKATNTDRVTITFISKEPLKEGETLDVIIKARTEKPFKKEIKAKYSIKIGKKDLDYKIEDVKNRNYATLILSNVKDSDNILNIEFDPNVLRVDLNNKFTKDLIDYSSITIGNNQYINRIKIRLPKESSGKIKFYKIDKTKDYTYPNLLNDSIVKIIKENNLKL